MVNDRKRRTVVTHRRPSAPIDHTADALAFEQEVLKAIEQAGFKISLFQSPLCDFAFGTANGDVVGVECKLGTGRAWSTIESYYERIEKEFPRSGFKEILLVVREAKPYLEAQFQQAGHPKVELVMLGQLPDVLARYKGPEPKTSGVVRAASNRIKGNRNEILIACTGLIAAIDDKLAMLAGQKPNSQDAIAKRDAEVSDYEKLKAEVEELRKAVEKYTANKLPEKTVEKKVATFEETAKAWVAKEGSKVLTKGADVSLFSLVLLLQCLLGGSVDLAILMSGGLVGGPKLVDSVAKGVKQVMGPRKRKTPDVGVE